MNEDQHPLRKEDPEPDPAIYRVRMTDIYVHAILREYSLAGHERMKRSEEEAMKIIQGVNP